MVGYPFGPGKRAGVPSEVYQSILQDLLDDFCFRVRRRHTGIHGRLQSAATASTVSKVLERLQKAGYNSTLTVRVRVRSTKYLGLS